MQIRCKTKWPQREKCIFSGDRACSVVCAQDAEELDLSSVDLTTLAAESDMAFLSEAFSLQPLAIRFLSSVRL
jgi:hypothetical protein